jgi:hypothetical protein
MLQMATHGTLMIANSSRGEANVIGYMQVNREDGDDMNRSK